MSEGGQKIKGKIKYKRIGDKLNMRLREVTVQDDSHLRLLAAAMGQMEVLLTVNTEGGANVFYPLLDTTDKQRGNRFQVGRKH